MQLVCTIEGSAVTIKEIKMKYYKEVVKCFVFVSEVKPLQLNKGYTEIKLNSKLVTIL